MNVLVLGARGQLGRSLVPIFGLDGPVRGATHSEVDITNPEVVASVMEAARPSIVLNAAAYTDVEGAEDDVVRAFEVNEGGARIIARAAAVAEVPVLHYSTDYVFDGSNNVPYEPDGATHPLGVYGRSKRAGEVAVQEENDRHYIVRTAWLYGLGGNNFVEKILRAAQDRPRLKVVDDQVGTPTFTEDLAVATQALIASGEFGVYHVVNAGACSRFEFAREILRLAGMDEAIIQPCKSGDFPTRAERPSYSALSNAKLEKVTAHSPRHWTEALRDYLHER